MADNTTLNAGSGGDTYGSDDIGGVKYQRVKLIVGIDGTNDGDVAGANPMPVYAPSAILASQSGNWTVYAITQPLPVGTNNLGSVGLLDAEDGRLESKVTTPAGTENALIVRNIPSGTQAVSNAGTFAVQAAQSGSWTVDLGATDNAVLDAIAASLAGTLTVGSHAVTNAGTFAVQAAQSGTWTVDLGATDNAVLDAIAASVAGTLNTELPTASSLGDATSNPSVPAVGGFGMVWNGSTWDRMPGSAAAGATVTIANPSSQTDNSSYTAGTDGGVPIQGFYQATPTTVTTGNVGTVGMTTNRELKVSLTTAIPAGTANIGDVDVLTVPAPLSTTGGGTEATALRVTIATDSTGVVSIDDNGSSITVDGTVGLSAGTNTNEVVGDVAHDAAAAGNPLLMAGAAQTMDDTAPPNRVSAESDATRLATCLDGALFVHPHGPQVWSKHLDGSTAYTDETIHASPGAGLSLYVTDIVVSTGAATAMNVFFEEGASKVLGPYYLEAVAGRGLALHFNTPKKITAATALTVTTSASIAQSIDVTGFVAAA